MKFFVENRALYEIMWKNIVEPDRPQMNIRRMRFAVWVPKATNTHLLYVFFFGSYNVHYRIYKDRPTNALSCMFIYFSQWHCLAETCRSHCEMWRNIQLSAFIGLSLYVTSMCNVYCFFTATKFSRTHHNVTFVWLRTLPGVFPSSVWGSNCNYQSLVFVLVFGLEVPVRQSGNKYVKA
jgi:hypothetical protein